MGAVITSAAVEISHNHQTGTKCPLSSTGQMEKGDRSSPPSLLIQFSHVLMAFLIMAEHKSNYTFPTLQLCSGFEVEKLYMLDKRACSV